VDGARAGVRLADAPFVGPAVGISSVRDVPRLVVCVRSAPLTGVRRRRHGLRRRDRDRGDDDDDDGRDGDDELGDDDDDLGGADD